MSILLLLNWNTLDKIFSAPDGIVLKSSAQKQIQLVTVITAIDRRFLIISIYTHSGTTVKSKWCVLLLRCSCSEREKTQVKLNLTALVTHWITLASSAHRWFFFFLCVLRAYGWKYDFHVCKCAFWKLCTMIGVENCSFRWVDEPWPYIAIYMWFYFHILYYYCLRTWGYALLRSVWMIFDEKKN